MRLSIHYRNEVRQLAPEDECLFLDRAFFDGAPSVSRSPDCIHIIWADDAWVVRNHSLSHGMWVRHPRPGGLVELEATWALRQEMTEVWPAIDGGDRHGVRVVLEHEPGKGNRRPGAPTLSPRQTVRPNSHGRLIASREDLDREAQVFFARESTRMVFACAFQDRWRPRGWSAPGQPGTTESESIAEITQTLPYGRKTVAKAFEGFHSHFLTPGHTLRSSERNRDFLFDNLIRLGLIGMEDFRHFEAQLQEL